MAQVCLLGLVQVAQKPPQRQQGGGISLGQGPGGLPAVLLFHQAAARLGLEAGRAAPLHPAVEFFLQKGGKLPLRTGSLIQKGLGGGEAAQLVHHVVDPLRPRKGGGVGLPGGDVAEAQSGVGFVDVDAADVVGLIPLQHGRVHGAGGDHPDDVPLHDALGGGGVLHLLADGDLVALGDQPGDISVAGVVGDAAHGGALVLGLRPVPGGQGQVQLLTGHDGVLVEHLIEVAQAEKEDGVLVLLFYFQVLLHHGGGICGHRSSSSLFAGSAGLVRLIFRLASALTNPPPCFIINNRRAAADQRFSSE